MRAALSPRFAARLFNGADSGTAQGRRAGLCVPARLLASFSRAVLLPFVVLQLFMGGIDKKRY